jgi:sugar phosphate isomerase/epimerase
MQYDNSRIEAYDFKFGITSLHLDSLGNAEPKSDLALSSFIGFDHSKRVRQLASQGFRCIELNADVGAVLPHTLSPESIDELQQIKKEYGLSYTVHLPILSIEPASPIQPVRQGAVQAMIDTIRATQRLEPDVYVYHATGDLAARVAHMPLPELARVFLQRAFQNYARESVEAILSATQLPSRQLAIETIQFPFDLTVELAEQLDTSVCLDTAHILVGYSGPINLEDAFEQALSRLSEVHLNDGPWQGPEHVIHYGKDHMALGMGDLDVAWVMNRLREVAFTGPVVFELTLNDALQSLDTIARTGAALKAA